MIPRINDVVKHGDEIGTIISNSGDEFFFINFGNHYEWLKLEEFELLDIPHCPNCGRPMVRLFCVDADQKCFWWECGKCNEKESDIYGNIKR